GRMTEEGPNSDICAPALPLRIDLHEHALRKAHPEAQSPRNLHFAHSLRGQFADVCLDRSICLRSPNIRPLARARASPAFTRSSMIERSNSANTPNIPYIALPDGVEVSSAC